MNLVWSKELVAITWDDEDFDVQKDESWAPEQDKENDVNTRGAGSPFGSVNAGSGKKSLASKKSQENGVNAPTDVGENNA
jgi:hypothetical protein